MSDFFLTKTELEGKTGPVWVVGMSGREEDIREDNRR
jgi:hypothetical protein